MKYLFVIMGLVFVCGASGQGSDGMKLVTSKTKHTHGYTILKDTRPGIPPLRLAIHCPYNNKDTVFILDSASFYYRIPYPKMQYYMYGQSDWVFNGRWPGTVIGPDVRNLYKDECEPLTTDTLKLIQWHQDRLMKLMRGNKK